MKRKLAILLALVMVFSAIPVVLAAQGADELIVIYSLADDPAFTDAEVGSAFDFENHPFLRGTASEITVRADADGQRYLHIAKAGHAGWDGLLITYDALLAGNVITINARMDTASDDALHIIFRWHDYPMYTQAAATYVEAGEVVTLTHAVEASELLPREGYYWCMETMSAVRGEVIPHAYVLEGVMGDHEDPSSRDSDFSVTNIIVYGEKSQLIVIDMGDDIESEYPEGGPPRNPLEDGTHSSWAAADIVIAVDAGLVPIQLQSLYTQATTRAEFAALAVTLYEHFHGEVEGRSAFDDTDNDYVLRAAYVGLVQGVGNNRFAPDNNLTREQAAVLVTRLANAINAPFPDDAAAFADNASIADWALIAVGRTQAAGIMGGVGNNNFAPQGSYTREQSIITMLRLLQFAEAAPTILVSLRTDRAVQFLPLGVALFEPVPFRRRIFAFGSASIVGGHFGDRAIYMSQRDPFVGFIFQASDPNLDANYLITVSGYLTTPASDVSVFLLIVNILIEVGFDEALLYLDYVEADGSFTFTIEISGEKLASGIDDYGNIQFHLFASGDYSFVVYDFVVVEAE